MNKSNSLVLLITSLILFCSCGQPVSHDKEVGYYVAIATEMNNTTAMVNAFWHQTLEAATAAQQNQNMKLDSSYMDTLYKSYQISTLALSKSIDRLSLIPEIDQNINLKERTLAHLKDTRKLQESALPDVLKVLTTGLGNLTDTERESFKEFQSRGGELLAAAAELEKLFLDFQNEHQITSEDLGRYGLKYP